MEPSDLLRTVSLFFEQYQIPYFVTGSLATIAYGEPRLTLDIDIVARMHEEHLDQLQDAFKPPDYYVSVDAAAEAIRRRKQFNIIHRYSGLKIDVMIPRDSDFDRSRFERAQRVRGGRNTEVWFASPEDVIIKKLEYYREGGSDKHIRDILGVLKVRGDSIDRNYIDEWSVRLHVEEQWAFVLQQLSSSH